MPNQTRRRILDAAIALFSEQGYEGVRTKQIAERADVSEVTLFKYFPKKELLYKEIFSEKYSPPDISLVIQSATYRSFEHDLTEIALKINRDFQKNKPLIEMKMREKRNFMSGRKIDRFEDPVRKALTPFFQRYADQNIITGEAERAVDIFVMSLKGMFHASVITGMDEQELTQIITDFITIFSKGVEK